MIHNEMSKAILEDASDGTRWSRDRGAVQAGRTAGGKHDTRNPRHIPVPAHPTAGPDPVPRLHVGARHP